MSSYTGAGVTIYDGGPGRRRQVATQHDFLWVWDLFGDGTPVECEYRFHPVRRWRADYAFPAERILVEIDGAVYVRGRHTRGKGFEADLEKINAATAMGYRCLRYSTGMLNADPIGVAEQVTATLRVVRREQNQHATG